MKLDVRRGWECPACGRRVQRQGDITSYQCHCQEPPVWMRLMEAQREHRSYQPYIVPEIAADDLIGDEEADPSEPLVSEETAILEEAIEPAEIEEIPLEDEFYSPEEETDDIPPLAEISPPESAYPPASEPAPPPAPVASSEQTPNTAPQERPRQGKSRRRRSGRKRSRRGGPQDGGGKN